jgi:hypothetical protein
MAVLEQRVLVFELACYEPSVALASCYFPHRSLHVPVYCNALPKVSLVLGVTIRRVVENLCDPTFAEGSAQL